MSEAGSTFWAAVTVIAAVGMFLSIRKKSAGAAIVCGLLGSAAWLTCFSAGNEIRNQASREAYRESRYRERREAMLAQYPLESLEERLPTPIATEVVQVSLSKESESDLTATEKITEARQNRRREILRKLHEGTVDVFSEEIGQGVSRMPVVVEQVLAAAARPDENPHQPEIHGSPDSPQQSSSIAAIEDSLKSLHRYGVEEFANAQDFGFVTKDGKRAAGFLSHRFTKPVKSDPRRRLKRFDLVGLLLNPEPVVYVSDKLPRMNELRAAPKRAPDDFETAAIDRLRDGEAVVIRDEPTGTRMVGAIRAAKQCLTCHESRRGELLGAFTYRFERL